MLASIITLDSLTDEGCRIAVAFQIESGHSRQYKAERMILRHMARLNDRQGASRKRGNPKWGQPLLPVPVITTEFESKVRQLGLTPETYLASRKLQLWCEQNLNRVYVPEELLKGWGLRVHLNYEEVA